MQKVRGSIPLGSTVGWLIDQPHERHSEVLAFVKQLTENWRPFIDAAGFVKLSVESSTIVSVNRRFRKYFEHRVLVRALIDL